MANVKLTMLQRLDSATNTRLGFMFKVDGPKQQDAKNGLLTEGIWCNFGSNKITFDSKDKGWVFTSDPDLMSPLTNIQQIEQAYEDGTIDQEKAVSMFKKSYGEWLTKKTAQMPDFIARDIDYPLDVKEEEKLSDKGELAGHIRRFFQDIKTFEMSSRFINTLNIVYHENGHEGVLEYVKSYFELANMAMEAEMIAAKMESDEWTDTIENGLQQMPVTKRINNRLKIYYGAAGTFKTTTAMTETDDCMLCNSSMLPSDLFKAFDFIDGQPIFKPAPLLNAMMGTSEKPQGWKITLDEFNLLPFETQRFCQTIFDGKKKFITPEGLEVNIGDDFGVIATMNLIVDNQVFGLPQPLIDRASELKEFELSDEQLGESF